MRLDLRNELTLEKVEGVLKTGSMVAGTLTLFLGVAAMLVESVRVKSAAGLIDKVRRGMLDFFVELARNPDKSNP